MKSVLKKLKPSKEENTKTKEIVTQFTNKIDHQVIVGGSYAKGTHLKGSHDIDVFIPFKTNEQLPTQCKQLLKPFRKVEQVHGSRDYFQVQYKGYTFEVVPVYKITKAEQAKNITDVSPLHVKWVKKHATAKIKDEIRLTKQFFRAQQLYGAETYIQGFSGYVLEILTIHYGSFTKLLKAATKWVGGQTIDPAKHKEGLNKSKRSPLIVIDPVQNDRNAAAALSKEKFEQAKLAATLYLKQPTEEAFTPNPPTKQQLKKIFDEVIELKLKRGKKDIVATKAKKATEIIQKKLTANGFTITATYFNVQNTALYALSVKETTIPTTYIRKGPPKDKKQNVKEFTKKHRNTFLKDNTYYATLKRQHTKLKPALKHMLKQKEVKERITSARL